MIGMLNPSSPAYLEDKLVLSFSAMTIPTSSPVTPKVAARVISNNMHSKAFSASPCEMSRGPSCRSRPGMRNRPSLSRRDTYHQSKQTRQVINIIPETKAESVTVQSNIAEPRGLQQIIPGMYLAFEDTASSSSTSPEFLRTNAGQEFTHIVNLSCTAPEQWQRLVDASGAERVSMRLPKHHFTEMFPWDYHTHQHKQILHLVAAKGASASCSKLTDVLMEHTGEGVTTLDYTQMMMGRDFLAGSGFDMKSDVSEAEMKQRLLIVCPRDRAVEAVSLLLCFASHVSECMVQELLDAFEGGVAPEWKGVVSTQGANFADAIARME